MKVKVDSMKSRGKKNHTATIAVVGSLILAVILVAGTMWTGSRAKRDTEDAVRSVSLLYMDELAGRRGQVVENNLQDKIETIRVAIDLMTEDDLSDKAHLEAYQARMKQLYHLDKFAFVDTEGLIYTSLGTQDNIDEYAFDYRTPFYIRKTRISGSSLPSRSAFPFRESSCPSASWKSTCRRCFPAFP